MKAFEGANCKPNLGETDNRAALAFCILRRFTISAGSNFLESMYFWTALNYPETCGPASS